jgi:cellulose synthase/poly-beta-1,6-N-acetylglucosamine synthase-like glycosyltransferase
MLKRLLHSPRLAPLKPLVGQIPVLGPWLTRIYHRDKATLNIDFDAWLIRRRRERNTEYPLPAGDAPTIDILTLTFQTDPTVLRKTADSVFAQDYPHWRWVIGDNGSTRPETLAVLEKIARHPNVVVERFRENHGIAEGHRLALARCSADYVALLDHDDLLMPDALRVGAWHIQRHSSPDFLYSDEDKCDMRDRHYYPYFKPDFSPALLLDTGYTCHLSVVRREKLIECGAFTDRDVEGTQDWDMAVRLYECGARVIHIPEILYTWRATPTSTAAAASAKRYIGNAHRECLTRHLVRRGMADRFEVQPNPMSAVPAIGLWRLRRLAESAGPLVDVLLVANGKDNELSATIAACVRETDYPNFRVRVVGSPIPGESDDSSALSNRPGNKGLGCTLPNRVTFEPPESPSQSLPEIINRMLREPPRGQLTADLVAFLPVGSRLLFRDWLWEAVGQFELHPQAAMIGGRMFNADQRVIGGAAVFGLLGSAQVAYENASRHDKGYFCINTVHRNVCAISDAPWIVRRAEALRVGGFDPELPVAFFEADFAARCHKAGLHVIASPYIAAVGNQRLGFADGVNQEWPALYREHANLLRDDPFYSPYLGFHNDAIYQLVEPANRGRFVNGRMLQVRSETGDADRFRNLPDDRYAISRNQEPAANEPATRLIVPVLGATVPIKQELAISFHPEAKAA